MKDPSNRSLRDARLTEIVSALRERLSLLMLIARALPKMTRRHGVRALTELLTRDARAMGWRRAVIQAGEMAAYEMRGDVGEYRRWVERHAVPGPETESADTVTVVMCCETADEGASDALRSIERQSHRGWRVGAENDNGCRHTLFMSKNCTLHERALALMLDALRSADIVYSDEDHIVEGVRREPVFKPEFSIDLQVASDYVGPVILCRGEWLGRHGFEPARCSPRAVLASASATRARIARVPEVLVHWSVPRPMAAAHASNPDLEAKLVSIVIPTRDRVDLLGRCVASIYCLPQSNAFEVLVLNNRSKERASHAWFESAPSRYARLRVIDADYEFNWSRLNNQGISETRGDVLVFLNNDTEALSERWLDRLVAHSLRDDVGTVGGLLFYPDRSIQHAGIVVGIGGVADHVYARCPDRGRDRHLFVSPYLPRNVLAVTGACVAMSRKTVDEIGRFDERFEICGDLELGIRAHNSGKLNVYDPDVQLLHHESATRPKVPLNEQELSRLRAVIEPFVRNGDPFYHPHLSLRSRYPTFAMPG